MFECDRLVFDPSIRFLATAHLIYIKWMSTAIPRRKYPVSLAPGSQATSGPVSTWMGDRLGIPGAVDFFLFFYACNFVNNYFMLRLKWSYCLNLNDFRQINCKLFECDWLVFDQSIWFLATAHLIYVIWMSTAIPRRKYPVSLAPGSQATSGPVSTWMGDRLGIPGAVDFFLFFYACNFVNNYFI